MHMADALLSPAVGGVFWAASAGILGHSAKKISSEENTAATPLMGVLGAFVFAAQMINFTIPGTGSSGHLGGGLLLAALLGPYRAFITLASILVVQCLFFADGGLLALGCNILNLAFFPAFVAYPFIFRKIAGESEKPARLGAASLVAATTGLLMGACAVVIQTVLSGVSDLPFGTFLLFMLPIHLAIGIVEGLVTWVVLAFVWRTHPAWLTSAKETTSPRRLVAVFAVAALIIGGFMAWFASGHPDGLEWSIARATGAEEVEHAGGKLYNLLAAVQEKLAFLPDYAFRTSAQEGQVAPPSASPADLGTTVSGIVGSILVILLAGALGLIFRAKAVKVSVDP